MPKRPRQAFADIIFIERPIVKDAGDKDKGNPCLRIALFILWTILMIGVGGAVCWRLGIIPAPDPCCAILDFDFELDRPAADGEGGIE